MFHYTRVEEYAKEDMDLTLTTTLEFSTPFADLSDVKTMMDSINVVPGLKHKLHYTSVSVKSVCSRLLHSVSTLKISHVM